MRISSLCVALALVFAIAFVLPVQAQPDDPDASCGKTSGLCWPRLKTGSKGATVQDLQFLLNAKGSKLKASGSFDAPTLKATKTFQMQHKLKVDGIVGYQTWEAMVPTLRKGDRGAFVKALQRFLWESNYGTPQDGYFGAGTERKVKEYQEAWDLDGTGIVDR